MVSHAVSQIFFTTVVNKKLNIRNVMRCHDMTCKLLCVIFSSLLVVLDASLGTCTQCVLVVLLADSDQFLDRSDRASNTSFACWRSNVRFHLCKNKICFLLFQKLPPLWPYQEVLFIDSSPQVISRPLQFAGFKEFAPSHYNVLLKDKSALNVSGW